MPRRYTPRLATFDYTGVYRYSLTICTHQRRAEFQSSSIVAETLRQIGRAAEMEDFAVLAYCFMPDHLHLLVAGNQGDSDARRFVARAKQLSGHRHRQQYGRFLWQRSAWDRVLRNQDDMWTTIRYILGNPVRAGLVEQVLDYPYSGSLVFDKAALLDAFAEG